MLMSHTNSQSSPQPTQKHPEGTTKGDPSLNEDALDKVMMRVEGQNENIVDPSEEEEANIAETARRLDEPMLQIEDES